MKVFDFDLFLIKVTRKKSQKFFSSGSILQKKVPNHDSEHLFRWISIVQDSDLASFLGDLSQSDKLSEIKLPLTNNRTLKTACLKVYLFSHVELNVRRL